MTMKNAGYVGYQLRELYASGGIGSIFNDPENQDDYIAGFVRGVNARTTLVEAISPYGRFDGWFALRLNSIQEIAYDALYANRLELLIQLFRERPAESIAQPEDDHIAATLRYAKEQGRVITLWTAAEACVGYVKALDDLRTTIVALDFMGETLGEMHFKLPDVEQVSLGSEEERMYEALSEHAKNHFA